MATTIKHLHHEHHQTNSVEGQQLYARDSIPPANAFNLRLKQGMLLGLWYMFSFFTIVLNKYILTMLGGDASFLGQTQMLMSVIFGGISLYALPCFVQRSGVEERKMVFFRNMTILGCLRFGTVVLSLISLKHVAVSFTETVKASAPLFTVILSFIILREKVGLLVMFSLIPVMAGLSLCSANEISFNVIGFVAAISNNIMDCPPELQFFTGTAALLIQLPYWCYVTDINETFKKPDYFYIGILILDSFSFYLQSVTAYGLMALISPITFSVANTVKRTLLIWLSVVVFANQVTWLSGLGTMIVTLGVVFYQKAKQIETADRHRHQYYNDTDHLRK